MSLIDTNAEEGTNKRDLMLFVLLFSHEDPRATLIYFYKVWG